MEAKLTYARLLVLFLVLVVVAILLAGPWSFSPVHKLNVREAERNIAKVERYCGKDKAEAFRDTIDVDDDTEYPMQQWIKLCLAAKD